MSAPALENQERPGRIIGRASLRFAVILVAIADLACVTYVDPIPADYSLEGSDQGVVIGRIEIVDKDGQPADAFDEWGLMVRRQGEGPFANPYIIAIAGPTTDFNAALPPGIYAWSFDSCDEALTFGVISGEVSYLGRLRLRYRPLLPCLGVKVEDDFAGAVERFRESHPELGAKVSKHLFLLWDCSLFSKCKPAR